MHKFFTFCCMLFFAAHLVAQPITSQQIDSLVEHSMKAFQVPGIAVAIIKDGKVIHSKGYGVRSLATGAKMDENTLFGIASNSKAFTTAALGILVDEGKIKWDDKVQDYIPEFKLYNPWVTEEFTIRDLLTHRSGMGLGAGDLMLFPDSSNFSLKDLIYNLRFLKPVSSFRSKYDYDNNLYIVAGEVVARVSGISWDAFVETRIMQPLGMSHSAGSFNRLKDASDVIDGHALVNGKVQVIPRNSSLIDHPAGGIYSSIADLSKWVIMHLNNGKYGDGSTPKTLLSQQVHDEMWSPQTILPVPGPGTYNTHFAAYGLGFMLNDVKGYKQVSHTGGLEGMVTQITMIPELKLGIIVLTNHEEGGAFQSITNQIKDAYFGITGTDRVTQYSKGRNQLLKADEARTDSIWKMISSRPFKSLTKNDSIAFTGTYRDPWFGEVFITVINGRLHFQSLRSPKLTGEMYLYKGNSYIVQWRDRSMHADAFVNFSLDNEGRAAGIKMNPVSPLTDFSYDFQDLDFVREK